MTNNNRWSQFLLLLLALTAFLCGSAEGQVLSWARQFGTAGVDQAKAVAVDNKGVFVAGLTFGSSAKQVPGAFLIKCDSAGNVIWTREFGSPDREAVFGVVVEETGVYVAGCADSLPGQISLGFGDAFVRKYDLDGNEVWTHQFGTPSSDYATGLATDGRALYVVGYSLDSLPGQRSEGEYDAFVRKYSLDGRELWTRQFGTPAHDQANGVALDGTGVYVVGVTEGALPGQSRTGRKDVFVRKYTAEGEELWTRQFGSSASDEGFAVAAAPSAVYIAGATAGTLPGQTRQGGAFLRKYDDTGRESWTRQFGEYGADELTAIAADSNAVFVGGQSLGSVPGRPGASSRNPVVRKFDPSGAEVWSLQFGTYSGSDDVFGLAVHGTSVYVVGDVAGSLPGQSSAGSRDAFLAMIRIPATLTSVPAATFAADSALAPESIASGFGERLASATEVAGSTPLPTTLGGTSVRIRDTANVERRAGLFFVSPGQINYLIPAGTATGPATVTVTSGDQEVATGAIRVDTVAPGLFSANTQGTGVAAASCLRIGSDGKRTEMLIFDPATQRSVPIDLGPAGDQVFLSLFGTGIRGYRSGVAATTGGLSVPVVGAAAQTQFAGLDQVNIGPLPRSLAGRGEIEVILKVDGKSANTVTVNIK